MAEILTYDPSTDPQAIARVEEAEAESLAIGEALAEQQEGLLAGKYKDAQELEKAYIELQRKLGKGETEDSEDVGEEVESEPTEESESEPDAQIDTLVKANNEYFETGEISEETLEAFSQMSSKELVDAYIRFQKQNPEATDRTGSTADLSDGEINQIKNSVGGEAQYNNLIEWAGSNFSPDEVDAFNNVIDSGNKSAIGFAIQALKSRYDDAMGYEGEMLSGKAARSNDVFRSQAELVRAMNDRRYDRDPAYRADVMEKLARSELDF